VAEALGRKVVADCKNFLWGLVISRKILRKCLLWEDSPNFPDAFIFLLKIRNTGASVIHLHFFVRWWWIVRNHFN